MTNLDFHDGRWHLDDRPVHAGMMAEMRFPDGEFVPIRIESARGGRELLAYFNFHGRQLSIDIYPHTDGDNLRWPPVHSADQRRAG